MPTTTNDNLLAKAEKIASNPVRKVLSKDEQLDVFNNARLILRLTAPIDFDEEEVNFELTRNQVQKIRDFCDLLHETLVTEYGCAMVAVYSCE